MAETTIEWADYTFNPWIGCEKVSAGCKHCYAERDTSNRVSTARGLPLWGPGSSRRRTSDANWRKPIAWNRKAKNDRESCAMALIPWRRPRVFGASLADVFEDRPELAPWRADLWGLIEATPELDWLLLTKRPENVRAMVPATWLGRTRYADEVPGEWPSHVWLGTTVEDRKAITRIDALREVSARVRFLSIEPLLEDLGTLDLRGISWVIVGGESGPSARPMHPDWVRSIREQCVAAGVPFFFKQWGEWYPADDDGQLRPPSRDPRLVIDCTRADDGRAFGKLGKKAAGRMLDGRTWDEVPHGS